MGQSQPGGFGLYEYKGHMQEQIGTAQMFMSWISEASMGE